MKLGKTAVMIAVTAAMAGVQLGASTAAHAAPDTYEVFEMLRSAGMIRPDGFVLKQDFIKMMEKRFDAMDKNKRGMLTPEDIAKILDGTTIPRG